MSAASQSAVLARMLRPARAAPSAGMSGARAWTRALPRVSELKVGLIVSVEGHDTGVTDLTALLGEWDEHALSLSVAGPGGARGLAVLSTELLAALIEVQTVGRVTNRAVTPRAPTAVDAALAGHVIDAWLAELAEVRAGSAAAAWRHTRRIADARAGKLALDDGVYEVETVHLSLGNGARTGTVRLVVPEGADALAERADAGGTGASVVLSVEAEVEAVLTRLTVPVSWFRDAGPETLIPIDPADLGRLTLETAEGQVIMRGRLGRMGDRKAVRLGGAPAPRDGQRGWSLPSAAPAMSARSGPPEGIAGAGAALPVADLSDLPELPALPDLPEPIG